MGEAIGPRDISKPQKQKIWIIFFENGIQIPDCVFRILEALIQTFLVGSACRIHLFLSFFHLPVLSFQSFQYCFACLIASPCLFFVLTQSKMTRVAPCSPK